MDRLFLDANVLFSAAYRERAGVGRLWSLSVTRVTSTYAVEEARRNLPEAVQRDRLGQLLEGVDVVDAGSPGPALRGDIMLPEKDWPIVGGAVTARATHLITGDLRDFGPYLGERILGVLVLTPADYLATREP